MRGHLAWTALLGLSLAGIFIFGRDGPGAAYWQAARLPVASLLIVSWVGLLFSFLPKAQQSMEGIRDPHQDIGLSKALPSEATLTAVATTRSRVAIFAIAFMLLAVAIHEWQLAAPPRPILALVATAGGLFMLRQGVRTITYQVILSPETIIWREYGKWFSRSYDEVADLEVFTKTEMRIVFGDGRRVSITADMADLVTVVATLTARRLA